MPYEKDYDDIMYEQNICLKCGWLIRFLPKYKYNCGCEEE